MRNRTPPTLRLASLLLALLCLAPRAPGADDDRAREREAVCGNGLIEAGESCASCAADCAVQACPSGRKQAAFEVRLEAPPARKPASAGVLLAYRGATLALPAGGGADLRGRVTMTPEGSLVAVNDLGYALRVVVSRSGGFAPGRLFRVAFDLCEGVKEAGASDLACTVEGCGSASGAIEGCACRAATAAEE